MLGKRSTRERKGHGLFARGIIVPFSGEGQLCHHAMYPETMSLVDGNVHSHIGPRAAPLRRITWGLPAVTLKWCRVYYYIQLTVPVLNGSAFVSPDDETLLREATLFRRGLLFDQKGMLCSKLRTAQVTKCIVRDVGDVRVRQPLFISLH